MSSHTTISEPDSSRQLVAAAIVEGIRAGKLHLPVMPQVAHRVFSLSNDPRADIDALSELIHSDQSIASHVLRIANSAAYGNGEPIVSLQEAVARLGMKLLGEIAIGAAVKTDVFDAPGFGREVRLLLKHALAAGAYGREIARMRRRNVDGQFLCGLLHSIGKPICLQLIANVTQAKRLHLGERDVAYSVARLHTKIAIKVALDWKLPKQVQLTIAYFNNYTAAPAFKDEAAATYLSQLLASWMMNPVKYETSAVSRDPAFEYLGFYEQDVQELFEKRDAIRAVVSAMET